MAAGIATVKVVAPAFRGGVPMAVRVIKSPTKPVIKDNNLLLAAINGIRDSINVSILIISIGRRRSRRRIIALLISRSLICGSLIRRRGIVG
jgi:hypothetical protein